MATILPKRKSTAGSVPAAGNLQSGELAVNTADGRLFTKLSDGTVVNLPVKSIDGQAISPSNVGIGTTAPTARLTVLGSGTGKMEVGTTGHGSNYTGICLNNSANSTSDYNLLSSPTDKRLYINRPAGLGMHFRENNADQVLIASGGNVGIGTTTPANSLHVVGTANTSTGHGVIVVANASTNATRVTHIGLPNDPHPFLAVLNGTTTAATFGWGFFDSNISGNLEIKRRSNSTTWVDALAISRVNGNVGIGNTAPDAKLTVKGSGASSLTKSLIVENSAGTDVLTVRDDGRVGINQASPTHTLTVTGAVQASGNIGGSSLSGSTVTADFVYTNEIYVGGNSDGYFALMDGNADTFFELSPFGLWTTKPIEFAPATSANPGAVGHVVFERVSNTSLKIKMRGTDNVVRSATLTLS